MGRFAKPYKYDAVVKLPDGDIIHGKCVAIDSDSNGIACVTIDDTCVICTHMSNIALICRKPSTDN